MQKTHTVKFEELEEGVETPKRATLKSRRSLKSKNGEKRTRGIFSLEDMIAEAEGNGSYQN